MCAIEQYRAHGLVRRVSEFVRQTLDAPQTKCLKLRHENIRPSSSPTTSAFVTNETLQERAEANNALHRKKKEPNALRGRTTPIDNWTLQQAKNDGFPNGAPLNKAKRSKRHRDAHQQAPAT